MTELDPYRALLAAEVGCALGLVDPEVTATVLQRTWESGAATETSLLDALVVAEGLAPADRPAVEREVARRLREAGGDPRGALAGPGTMPSALHKSLAGGVPALSHALARGLHPDGPELRPMRPDRYTDFSPAGEGGMGIVYWALDTELSRQVAIKIVRPPEHEKRGEVTPPAPLAVSPPKVGSSEADVFESLRLRFLQEAWVTGGMEHPGIVPVYELGQTSEGVPYYAMRFIRGSRTLKTAIEESAGEGTSARIDQLLESFLKVCDTVRYAHAKGVVHRDLKPDNVALGEYGEVVVLDWGLAKVKDALDPVDDPWAERVLDLRESGDLHTLASTVGTPGYLSPEAAAGRVKEVDERSDVFALGVMLFQVLTGRLPHTFTTSAEYVEQVLGTDAPDARTVRADAPTRLSELCTSALAREPANRPASADAFAAEIRAWRAEAAKEREIEVRLTEANAALDAARAHTGDELLRELDRAAAAGRRILELEPGHDDGLALVERAAERRERGIQQRERGARLRTLKRVGAAAAVVAVVAAVSVATVLERQRREAVDARRQAEDDRARAEDVMGFMVVDLRDSVEPTGRLTVLEEIGRKAEDYYAKLPRENVDSASLERFALTLRQLGDVYRDLGNLGAAREAYGRAADVAGRILEQAPDDPVGRYNLSLAQAREGTALMLQGRIQDAEQRLIAHRADVLRLLEDHPDEKEYLEALAEAHASLSQVAKNAGDWGEADAALREAIEIFARLESDHPDEPEWPRRRIGKQLERVFGLRLVGEKDLAVEEARRALDEVLERRRDERIRQDIRWRALEAAGLNMLARARTTKDAEAYAIFEDALSAYRSLHAATPENLRWQASTAHILLLLGDYHNTQRDTPRALVFTTEAYDIMRGLTTRDPTNARWQNLLISICDRMASHASRAGASEEQSRTYRLTAEEHARRLLELEPTNGKWRHIHAYALSRLGITYRVSDKARARQALTRSIAVAVELFAESPGSYEVAMLLHDSRITLAALYLEAGRREDALTHWRRTMEEMLACWAIRRDRAALVVSTLKTSILLAQELADGSPAERKEAKQVREMALDLAERRVIEEGGWPPEKIEGLKSRRDLIRAELDAQKEAESPPR